MVKSHNLVLIEESLWMKNKICNAFSGATNERFEFRAYEPIGFRAYCYELRQVLKNKFEASAALSYVRFYTDAFLDEMSSAQKLPTQAPNTESVFAFEIHSERRKSIERIHAKLSEIRKISRQPKPTIAAIKQLGTLLEHEIENPPHFPEFRDLMLLKWLYGTLYHAGAMPLSSRVDHLQHAFNVAKYFAAPLEESIISRMRTKLTAPFFEQINLMGRQLQLLTPTLKLVDPRVSSGSMYTQSGKLRGRFDHAYCEMIGNIPQNKVYVLSNILDALIEFELTSASNFTMARNNLFNQLSLINFHETKPDLEKKSFVEPLLSSITEIINCPETNLLQQEVQRIAMRNFIRDLSLKIYMVSPLKLLQAPSFTYKNVNNGQNVINAPLSEAGLTASHL